MTNLHPPTSPDTLQQARDRLLHIVRQERLLDSDVTVLLKPLTPKEAIGDPERQDFPIIIGKERMIEATVLDARGHAFTDTPRELAATVAQILELPLDQTPHRAIFIATLNAVLRHLGQVTATVHCKDEDPELCALELATSLLKEHGQVKVGLVGLNPAIAQRLADAFGADHVRITDLNRDNIGSSRFGVEIWDGGKRTGELVEVSELLLVTGTTLVNGTYDTIAGLARQAGKRVVLYGVTAAGVCHLLGLERRCPRGQDG